ncbi:hypothetical protein QVD17_39708 [Tagetes erecta]|uniref:Uncharacterized protein n=1 Tax=Tagetes erecta TaxID=13708 RepID=A0AAD8NHD2_TARER|nr:hypothetical protein QVD17_39708 [Tagetes erecta]
MHEIISCLIMIFPCATIQGKMLLSSPTSKVESLVKFLLKVLPRLGDFRVYSLLGKKFVEFHINPSVEPVVDLETFVPKPHPKPGVLSETSSRETCVCL